MHNLAVGDTVQNSVQRAVVRWLGSIEQIPIIGLQSVDSMLPGYTDGTCTYDNQRYFNCPDGQGYYILATDWANSYTIVRKTVPTVKQFGSDDEFNSAEQSLSTSPAETPAIPQAILSPSLPFVSKTEHTSDNHPFMSPSRGILSRLVSEREQRNNQRMPLTTDSKEELFTHTSSFELDAQSSRIYRPENYKSTSCDDTEESHRYNSTATDDDDEIGGNPSSSPLINNNHSPLSNNSLPLFGREYFLNGWTLSQVNLFLGNQIPTDRQLCLNIYTDQCNTQSLVDEQINGCLSLVPTEVPTDVCIELIKLFEHVNTIFPSRAVRLYDNDYLLLAIACSNNQCAYVRTTLGWAYVDDESDDGQSVIIDDITRMIDDCNCDAQYKSEQCRHVLTNASFLYYKLVA